MQGIGSHEAESRTRTSNQGNGSPEVEKGGQELKIIEKIASLKTMLERNKKMDETQECMEHLKGNG